MHCCILYYVHCARTQTHSSCRLNVRATFSKRRSTATASNAIHYDQSNLLIFHLLYLMYIYTTQHKDFFSSLEAISKQNERINWNHTGIFARNFVLMIVISDVLILSVHQKHIALNHVNNFNFNLKIIVPTITASNHLDIALEIIANWNAYQVVRSIERRINRSTERSDSVCCWTESSRTRQLNDSQTKIDWKNANPLLICTAYVYRERL